ncbi:MAG: hypothetical protein ROO73_03570 [Roseivirga sp.]
MIRFMEILLLLALFSFLSACNWEADEDPSEAKGAGGLSKFTAYFQERAHQKGDIALATPIVLVIGVEHSLSQVREGAEETASPPLPPACTLLRWRLSLGLEGTLNNEEGEPVGKDYKLKEGKQTFVLVLKKMEKMVTKPQLTLELEGGAPRELTVDLSEAVSARMAYQGVALEEEVRELAARTEALLSSAASHEERKLALARVQHDQGRLLTRISSLQATLSALDSEQGHEEPLCFALTELHERTEKIIGAEIDQVALEVKIKDRFGRGVNERHPTRHTTPLQEVVFAGDEQTLEELLSYKAIDLGKHYTYCLDKGAATYPCYEEVYLYPPLTLACMALEHLSYEKCMRMIKKLLEAGADPMQSLQFTDPRGVETLESYLWEVMFGSAVVEDNFGLEEDQVEAVYQLLKAYGLQ